MIRVVVVDDEPMVCAHLRTILGSAGDIEVIDEAHDGAAGVEAVVRSRPDVVLMDLRMPGVDGLTAIERIGQLAHPPVVVVLTTFDADQYVLRADLPGLSDGDVNVQLEDNVLTISGERKAEHED